MRKFLAATRSCCSPRASPAGGWPAVARLPVAPGERDVRRPRAFRRLGQRNISVSASELRGKSTGCASDMQGKVGPIKGSERNASWLDPVRMSTLRYTSHARRLLTRNDDAVDVFADERRWKSEKGLEGETSTSAPLDELSFLFYLRTLPLTGDTTLTLSRISTSREIRRSYRIIGRR